MSHQTNDWVTVKNLVVVRFTLLSYNKNNNKKNLNYIQVFERLQNVNNWLRQSCLFGRLPVNLFPIAQTSPSPNNTRLRLNNNRRKNKNCQVLLEIKQYNIKQWFSLRRKYQTMVLFQKKVSNNGSQITHTSEREHITHPSE